MGDHHQTSGETESIPCAGHGAFVGQVLGDLLEPSPDEPVERLQEENRLAESVEQLPGRITAGQMCQLVGEETRLMLDSEVADPFGTTDLRMSDARRKGHRDGLGGAEPKGSPKTHGGGQAFDQSSRRTNAAGLQKPLEIEGRSAEDQQRHQRTDAPQR
jgi:hypothetical protein